jgi:hypothetical protein
VYFNTLLGGGFGLYLKQLDLMSQQELRTLLPIDAWPKPRSTSDLDIFLTLQVLISLPEMQSVRSIIDEMNFVPISGSEYYQFVKPTNQIKIDLLTGPIEESVKSKVKSDTRRARPKGNLQLHAHPVPEALDLSKNLEQLSLAGRLPDDRRYVAIVNIPNPFTYLMMKVTAFGDQMENADEDFGRHHSLDVYRIVAMLNESQFEQTKKQFADNEHSPYTQSVKSLYDHCFSAKHKIGILRMKEHRFFGANMLINDFIESLRDLMNL